MNLSESEKPVYFPTHEYAPFKGGIAVYVEELANACAEAGAVPVVFAPDYGGLDAEAGPVRIIRVPMRGRQDWICRWRMGRAMARELGRNTVRGTIVLAEPGPIRWWMYGRVTRPPEADRLVVILHGSELKKLSSNPVRKWLLGKLLQRVDRVGVVSGPVRSLALDAFPGLEHKLEIVPGAVRACMRNLPMPDWGSRRHEILQVGRLHPRKGQLELVEAIGQLPGALREQFLLKLVGPHTNPAYASRVRQSATRLSVRIDMPGELDESRLLDAYSRARLLVMPSRNFKSSVEGLGLVLLEAQYLGCPVVACDAGGIRDALIPERTGLLVPPQDTGQLARAIQHLLQDDRLAAEMGIQGRQFVNQSFSWSRNARVMGLI